MSASNGAASERSRLRRAALAAGGNRRGIREMWRTLRALLPPGTPLRLGLVAVLSIVGGFAEAALLALVVNTALGLAGDADRVDASLGAGLDLELSVRTSIAIASVVLAIRIACQFSAAVITARVGSRSYEQVRRRIFEAFLASDWDLQSREKDGHLQELLGTHVSRLNNSVFGVGNALAAGLNLAAMLSAAVLVDPIPAAAVLVAACLLFFIFRPLAFRAREANRAQAVDNLDVMERVSQVVVLARDIRTAGAEATVAADGGRLIAIAARSFHRSRILASVMAPLFQGVALALVLLGLAAISITGVSNLGVLGAIVLILLRSLSYAQTLQGAYQTVYENVPFVESLIDKLDAYRDAAVDRTGRDIGAVGAIEFAGVRFGYDPAVPVLSDLSFRISAGEAIGIVGPSGGGKSTLIQLLLRLRQPQEGRILADGAPIDEIALDAWYREVALVPQDAHLFSGTVRDNIAFYRDYTDEEVERASTLANLHQTVQAWPEGYATPVGERGGAVSGGQRQRICIARGLISNPSMLILDEPTSALDVESEAVIQEMLQQLSGSRTLLIVAHRLSTLSLCDRIMVIEDGRVAAFEPASDLAEREGFYRRALEKSRAAPSAN